MEWTTASEQIEGLSSNDLDSYLLDLVEVAVIAVDAQGTVFRWNRHAERIYGWPAGEAVGRPLVDLAIAPGNVRLAQGVMKTVVGGEVWDGDLPVLRKDGSAITVRARIQPVHDAHGELMAMVGFSTDVTERRRSEAERK